LRKRLCTFILLAVCLSGGGVILFEAYTAATMKHIAEERVHYDTARKLSSSKKSEATGILRLVNEEHPLPPSYKPRLKRLANGLQFDERAINQLKLMLEDARAQGLSPVVCSAYRSFAYQEELFQRQVTKQMSKGLCRQQAEKEARKVVVSPGRSEHNLGLAADIVSLSYQHLDEAQANTPENKWLREHASDYGFILRYPKDKEEITGVVYEPWHFRYVGIDAAKAIIESGLCLEEYLESL
jgi:D-alanyl-D-alanine carboxypeptidase